MTSACRIQQIRAELVELRWNDGQFCVTADHSVLVKACGDSPWQAKQARNVRPDEDQLLIVPAPVPAAIASSDLCLVVVTERRVYEAVQDVIEVEMAYPANRLLASSTCSDGPFVTVLGKQPQVLLRGDQCHADIPLSSCLAGSLPPKRVSPGMCLAVKGVRLLPFLERSAFPWQGRVSCGRRCS